MAETHSRFKNIEFETEKDIERLVKQDLSKSKEFKTELGKRATEKVAMSLLHLSVLPEKGPIDDDMFEAVMNYSQTIGKPEVTPEDRANILVFGEQAGYFEKSKEFEGIWNYEPYLHTGIKELFNKLRNS